jgi:predicted RNA binding protein YcfA (HicA-like mRNA interferase family)
MPKIVPIPASRLRKIFEKDGFKCVRTAGINRERYFQLLKEIK